MMEKYILVKANQLGVYFCGLSWKGPISEDDPEKALVFRDTNTAKTFQEYLLNAFGSGGWIIQSLEKAQSGFFLRYIKRIPFP